MSSAAVKLKFNWGLTQSEPDSKPVLFVGQSSHLASLDWKDVRCKLEPQVTEEVWKRSISCITESPGESCPLWPRGATIASLPAERSRHAAPSRCHALAKVVKNSAPKKVQCIVLVCRKRDVYASVMAIARSFPLFSARTGGVNPVSNVVDTDRTVNLEILLVGDLPDGDTESDLGTLDPYLYDTTLSEEDLQVLRHSAEATRLAARITDTPTNFMNVDEFIEEAIKVSKDLNLQSPTIIRGEQLKAKGLGGIYGVGQASVSPPALVVLSYKGGDIDVAWVGKGIVYDTGGLSIKARTSMVGMKSDCGGAAAVLGAFASFVRTKPKINLHAVLCIAENSVGPKATRPDDIHTLYSGLTVEINNTDAEGRLVLSDGVVYADRDLKAKIIVDVATLTGAQGTATGKYHAAVICNNATLENKAIKAGLLSGDLTHALPFAPDLHFSELSSVVADMKNSVADRNNAQPSCAGLFILAHLGFNFSGQWLHVDMAAPAHCGERATGYGVSLLNVLFGAHSQSKLLQALSPGSTFT